MAIEFRDFPLADQPASAMKIPCRYIEFNVMQVVHTLHQDPTSYDLNVCYGLEVKSPDIYHQAAFFKVIEFRSNRTDY